MDETRPVVLGRLRVKEGRIGFEPRGPSLVEGQVGVPVEVGVLYAYREWDRAKETLELRFDVHAAHLRESASRTVADRPVVVDEEDGILVGRFVFEEPTETDATFEVRVRHSATAWSGSGGSDVAEGRVGGTFRLRVR